MGLEDVIGAVQRLNVPMEALAALAAELRIRSEGLEPDPAIRERIAAVVDRLGVGDLDELPPEVLQVAAGAARAFFRQAELMMEDPTRERGWVSDDPLVLQSTGRASMMVSTILTQVAPQLGLDGRLGDGDAAFLDLGTGVGWLAAAMAMSWPELRVVGVDRFEPALELARANLAAAGLTDRVELRTADAADLDYHEEFDLVWVPGPFLAPGIVPACLDGVRRALVAGGTVVFGLFATVDDPLAEATQDLRVVRCGGHPWQIAEAESLLTEAGFADAHEIERTWNAPLRIVVGRKG